MSLLLQAGADIHERDEYQETKLHQFVRKGNRHDENLILLQYGKDYTIRNEMGHTAYELALLLHDGDIAHVIRDTVRQFKEDVQRLIG